MKYIATLGLILAAAGAAPAVAHTVSVPHGSGAVLAKYQGTVTVEHRQIGSPAPGGRTASLRCAWTANLAVDRLATTATGAMASRSFTQPKIATGSRPGWCSGNRSAIARDVAARTSDVDKHIAEAAHSDKSALSAELDRLTSQPS